MEREQSVRRLLCSYGSSSSNSLAQSGSLSPQQRDRDCSSWQRIAQLWAATVVALISLGLIAATLLPNQAISMQEIIRRQSSLGGVPSRLGLLSGAWGTAHPVLSFIVKPEPLDSELPPTLPGTMDMPGTMDLPDLSAKMEMPGTMDLPDSSAKMEMPGTKDLPDLSAKMMDEDNDIVGALGDDRPESRLREGAQSSVDCTAGYKMELVVPPSDHPFTPGTLVVNAGLPRTGSTTLFNMMRVLLRSQDPNLVAGFLNWYGMPVVKEWLNLNVTVLIKTHVVNRDIYPVMNMVTFSHRDPVSQVCSRKLFGLPAGTPPSAWNRTANHTYTITQDLLCRQRQLYRSAISRDAKMVYDMDYDDLERDPRAVLAEVAEALGIGSLDRRDIDTMWKEVQGLRPVSINKRSINPVSMLHHDHNKRVYPKDIGACKKIVSRQLLDDPEYKMWMERGGKLLKASEVFAKLGKPSRCVLDF